MAKTARSRKSLDTPSERHDEAERVLPHDLGAEKAIFGAIMLRNDAFESVSQLIDATDFYRGAHQRIWLSLERLREHGGAVDLLTLRSDLGRAGDLEECGGPAYLSALVDGVPRSTNVLQYASIVKDKAMLRRLIFYANKVASSAYAADDPAQEVYGVADRELIALHGREPSVMLSLQATAPSLMVDLQQRYDHRGELTGLDTGFASINGETMGWQAGDMVVIAARPSIGKSAFVLNTAVASSKAGSWVGIFSMEMSRAQNEYRILSKLSQIPLTRIRNGYILGDEEWRRLSDAIAAMGNLHLAIDDTSARTVADIRNVCRRMQSERGLAAVIIDYVQLMPGNLERRGATRHDEITDISRRLKVMAGELKIAVLLVSQLSRAGEGRTDQRPRLSDLRESGSLEEHADLVCFLHRRNHREGGVTNFIIEKQRNGPTGTVNLTLDRDTQTFTDGGEEPAAPDKTAEEKQLEKTRAIIRNRRRQSSS